ncbi:sensor histidine kinase [Pseudomonas rhizoryzae]|uniref:sensor histidine kinase n=1 Tax=Pseudomonas rhizoryzae TaxID=2571129 RepID=UPI0007370F15|nr:histidine kinase [Pseudomonas psychrotolerans]KTT13064.1 histidine kinase [Pseudomonas psychrotolerans]KTT34419.1 histidine kinase [Pseudomonas psychrotolerans]KTT54237.1 histidine kinase [Pseudomonas psychrotolerans]KTT72730.1 histidine kinase [Pseudomonas psychrotolerans]
MPVQALSPSVPAETVAEASASAQAREALGQMSRQLSESFQLLEARMNSLQGELEWVSAQRLQELAEKERLASRLQNLLDVLPAGIVVVDGGGRVRDANPVAVALLGEPLVGELWRAVIARAFAPRHDDGHEVSLRDGRRVSIATRSLDGEPGQLVLLNDLTETRHLQGELARHERLSALGRTMASLAHQIRTPLTAALLYASHLEEGGLAVAQQQRFASRLKERLHELENQVRDMLVFARGELPLADRLTPSALFAALRESAAPHLDGCQVRWQDDAGSGLLACNRDMLVGAALNLIHNALQAMAGSGRPGQLKVHLYRRAAELRLAISDTGPGIPPAVQQRLGEPFLSTKTTGTGLGLPVALAMAKAHGGQLTVRSRLGRGTLVTFILPLLKTEETPA